MDDQRRNLIGHSHYSSAAAHSLKGSRSGANAPYSMEILQLPIWATCMSAGAPLSIRSAIPNGVSERSGNSHAMTQTSTACKRFGLRITCIRGNLASLRRLQPSKKEPRDLCSAQEQGQVGTECLLQKDWVNTGRWVDTGTQYD